MENSNGGSTLNNPNRELFCPPPPRRPIPSNSFNALVKIFSLFSDQNPFSEYAKIPEYSRRYRDNLNHSSPHLSDDLCNDVVAPSGENEASKDLAGSDTTEAHILPANGGCEVNEDISMDFCKDVSFSGSKLLVETNKNKTMDKLPSDEEGTSVGMTGMTEIDKVHEELSGIERLLMDESDNFGVLQLADEDVSHEVSNDFSCILDTDVQVNNSMHIKSSGGGKLAVDGNMKGDVAGEKKRKDLEVNRSTSGGDEARSNTHLSMVREISYHQESVNQFVGACPGEAQREQIKICKEKAPQDLPVFGGLTCAAQKSNSLGGTVSNSIGKENKLGVASMSKTKKVKKTSTKNVNSGKSNLLVIDGMTSNSKKPGGANTVLCGNTVKQSVSAFSGKITTRKVVNNQLKSREKFQYTREELLNLWKMTSVPEDVQKIVQEIDAEIHGRNQKSAAGKMTDAVGTKEKLGPLTKDKVYEKEGSSIPKNKIRGSSSEAKKERKKKRKRKKRAEMEQKLGIKRLKLKTIVKPKVIQPCRHYLKGRCQEGEDCKFSHDVIPLTKSKPCCHFARQACMKGNDCPFDHQLSNYPCNSYATSGFCSRGDGCLFSHKIQAMECSETAPLELLNSNSKEQLNANASFSPGLATQTSQHAKAPKGLSFLSSGKSSLKDSGDFSQKGNYAAETSNHPNIAKTAVINSVKTPMEALASGTPQGTDFISFMPALVSSSSGDKKQADHLFQRNISRFTSFGKSEKVDSSHTKDATAGTSNLLNKGMSSKVQSVCVIPEANPAPLDPKQVSVPSSDCSGKLLATLPTDGLPDSRIREKESANGSEKENQQKIWDSLASSSQGINTVGVKNTPNKAQRALLSTFAFAAKCESGIKMTSTASSKNDGTNSGTGSRQNEPSKASAILDFLYSGSNKKKQ